MKGIIHNSKDLIKIYPNLVWILSHHIELTYFAAKLHQPQTTQYPNASSKACTLNKLRFGSDVRSLTPAKTEVCIEAKKELSKITDAADYGHYKQGR